MEILRLPHVSALSFDIESLEPETMYRVELIDRSTSESYELDIESDVDGTLIIPIPTTYKIHDGNLTCTVFDGSSVAYLDDVEIVRPYTDPSRVADILDIPVEHATQYERIARYMIDAKTGGFKYERRTKAVLGLGSDYLPLNERIWGLESLYENGALIWDALDTWPTNYVISPDRSSIVEENVDDNLEEYRPVWNSRYSTPAFPDGYDYVVHGVFGWVNIPNDIKEASHLLIDDIKCGNSRYINKYIQAFQTDAFQIRYDKSFKETTGNLIVDNILEKYAGAIRARML